MRKIILLGCLCLGGLILAGAGCGSDDPPKEPGKDQPGKDQPGKDQPGKEGNQNTPAEQVRLCKADNKIEVRYFSCDPDGEWYGCSEAQQQDLISQGNAWCDNSGNAKEIADWFTEAYECARIDVSSYEALAKTVDTAAAQSCAAVIKATEEGEFYCAAK